ncbi:hypothetical protein BCY84_16252 [Trypanosoma cruzi cruzi]|nr:hypothetical protein BCY84_16252 [Trypanosoma cruzi cruzi]
MNRWSSCPCIGKTLFFSSFSCILRDEHVMHTHTHTHSRVRFYLNFQIFSVCPNCFLALPSTVAVSTGSLIFFGVYRIYTNGLRVVGSFFFVCVCFYLSHACFRVCLPAVTVDGVVSGTASWRCVCLHLAAGDSCL